MAPHAEFSKRIKNVRGKMNDREIDVLVVYSAPGSIRFGQRGHVMYLSGYEPYFGNTMVILPADEDLSPLLEIGAANYFPPECTWIENVKSAGDHVQLLKDYLRENGLKESRIGLVGEYSMSPSLYARFQNEIGQSQIEVASDILEEERAVKSEYEIQCMKKNAQIAKKGIEAAAKFARPGVSESEIVGEIERVCRIAGSQGFPHHTMVISGKDLNHLNWWWYCGKRKLKQGDLWGLDFGTMYNGYCCDISRPFTIGVASKKQKDVFQVLVQAQEAAQKTAREGVLTSDVNKAANEAMREAWKEYSGKVGHGVGLEVHEWPFIGYQRILDDKAYRDRRLKANMVISLEPSIYLPELGDFQIEDQFRVTKTGCERLNDIPQEIMES